MTTIEKAKAYDEALNWMRELYPGLRGATKEDAEHYFPELAESEDDRNWKSIEKAIRGFITSPIDADELLAWLEKQKEHQSCPDAPKEKKLGGDFYSSDKDKNLDEIAQDYVDGVKEYNPEPTWDLMQTAVCYGYHLSEEQFEKNRLANCDAVSKEECDRETDFAMEIIEKEHRHPTFNDAINYGMRLQKQKEQKPAEWSEEEKRKLNRIYSIIGWAMDEHAFSSCKKLLGDKEGVELQDFLRSIAKPKQEWGEEDRNKVAKYLHERDGGMLWSRAKDITDDILDMLRPSWKPSEEQMSMLLAVINDPNNAGAESCHLALNSIYKNLKKLQNNNL